MVLVLVNLKLYFHFEFVLDNVGNHKYKLNDEVALSESEIISYEIKKTVEQLSKKFKKGVLIYSFVLIH